MIEAGGTEQEGMGSLPAWESELQLWGLEISGTIAAGGGNDN